MLTYEFEGKTTEEAIQNASRELNLPVDELNVDIIEPGSAGIFGLVGGRKAKIKVNMRSAVKVPDRHPDGLALARETLEQILALIPVDTTVKADQADGKISLTIAGDKSGLLIGKKGKTLDALQYIVNRIVNKATEKKSSIVIDSEDYRKRRNETLTQMALKMGEKAKRIGKPVTTNPLSPHERRIVHLALSDDEGLDTKSRGEGLLKKVVIVPKR